MERVSAGQFKWERSEEERGGERGAMTNPGIAFVVKTEWSYGVLKASELGNHVCMFVCWDAVFVCMQCSEGNGALCMFVQCVEMFVRILHY